ncbi:HlyD family type I secretion periplasmic adaptor subunit [Mangrovibrevibacter kandeliae]|uniref:HlyD family type I secretion periplasmic adaptor subunit n=1 Tax=Mangrovibrevibacter kandeliae TaxID=2968473 RepID=UPI002119A883|nr:HlyD family type I secretion periplasmic adaptor subunit [Aurantimonas sp. CSK15Z-1]MCQ8783764.1 HlyD family type I secretion periplasmic adaptor subunit [Aurantimonas sp. CSK15Z-1]
MSVALVQQPQPTAVRERVSVETLTLTRPLLVQETAPQRFVRRTALLVSSAILALVAWSAVAKVHEISQARGTILPAGFERVVQHYEGGIVRDILVQPGDRVEAGTPLFLLDDSTTAEDVDVATKQARSLQAQIEGLDALAGSRTPNFAGSGDALADRFAALSYDARRDAQDTQVRLLESQIEQARQSIAVYDAQLAGLKDDRSFAEDNVSRLDALVKQGYATRAQLAERRKAQQTVDTQIRVTQERRQSAIEGLNEAQRNLAAFRAAARAELANRLQELNTTLAAAEGSVSRSSRRKERLVVASPVRGVVKALEVKTIGGVVESGQPLATIVPVDEAFFAETRLPVSQVGHVRAGMPVHLKVSAFEFTRFGWIDGEVASVSPSSFSEPGLPPYYTVRVNLDADHLPFDPAARVAPGMSVDADIITGERTILSYFLSPITKALKTAFGER